MLMYKLLLAAMLLAGISTVAAIPAHPTVAESYADDICIRVYLLDTNKQRARVTCYDYFLLYRDDEYAQICEYDVVKYINKNDGSTWIAFVNNEVLSCQNL